MRRTIVILCMIACIPAHGQHRREAGASISADLAAAVTDMAVRLEFSHSFTKHWSVQGSAEVQIPWKGPSPAGNESGNRIRPEFTAGMRFWPEGFAEGSYLGVNCCHGVETGTDLTIGGGYSIRIMNHLGLCLGYELKILDSIQKGRFGAEGIRINLTYYF